MRIYFGNIRNLILFTLLSMIFLIPELAYSLLSDPNNVSEPTDPFCKF